MRPHIVVCIKAVVAKASRGRIARTSENVRLNPFDLPAIESALQLRSKFGGSVTALSMGPPSGRVVMAEALAMGVDRAVLVSDPCLAGADTLATSTTLAAALHKLAPCDLVLFGARSSDSDTGQVGPQTAVALGIPLVTGVNRVEPCIGGLRVERTLDDTVETFELDFPAALTIRPEAARPVPSAWAAWPRRSITPRWNCSPVRTSNWRRRRWARPGRPRACFPCSRSRTSAAAGSWKADRRKSRIGSWITLLPRASSIDDGLKLPRTGTCGCT